MSEFQHKRSESKEKSAVSATVRARDMLCDLSGPRGWNDNRESWLARGARRAGLTLRRARAIFYQEPIRLTADEYLAIERAYTSANEALETLSTMASDTDVRAHRATEERSRLAETEGRPAGAGEQHRAAGAAVRPAR